MRINKYTFSDGSTCEAYTIEQAVAIQSAAGRSTRVTKRVAGLRGQR